MIVVSAGMPRSASTLLFNMVREILICEHGQKAVVPIWREVPGSSDKVYIVKTHMLQRKQLRNVDFIFYSYRDIRTAMVSNFRKFGETPSIEWARKYIREWENARKFANQMWRFEMLTTYPTVVISSIADVLSIPVDVDKIWKSISNYELPVQEHVLDPITMLHANHHTHTEADDWRMVLDRDLQKQLNEEFSWWFLLYSYPVE